MSSKTSITRLSYNKAVLSDMNVNLLLSNSFEVSLCASLNFDVISSTSGTSPTSLI